ncbi:MAG: PfkB family carbohydrate kinase, partial [Pseudomonadota bacterium]
ISLSDPFCVERHRADFVALARELDFVIGNEAEWMSLYETSLLDAALDRASEECRLIVCTRSGSEVVIKNGKEAVRINVDEISPVDTTGAGDQFAAGFLYGLATGQSLDVSGRMGCIAAAEVIGHYGARPEADVYALFQKAGLV